MEDGYPLNFFYMGNAFLPSRRTRGLDTRSSFTVFSFGAPTRNTVAPRSGIIGTSRWIGTNSPRSFRARNARVPFDVTLEIPHYPCACMSQSIMVVIRWKSRDSAGTIYIV